MSGGLVAIAADQRHFGQAQALATLAAFVINVLMI